MAFALVVVAVLSAATAIFALQNNQPLSLRFLAWSLENVPLAGAILAALGAGLLLAAIPFQIAQWRLRRRTRALEARVEMLETALTTRDTALLTPRTAPPPPPAARTA